MMLIPTKKAAFSIILLLSMLYYTNASNFTKRKYFHFKRGNGKAIVKPTLIKKNKPKPSTLIDSLPQFIITEKNEVTQNQVMNTIDLPIKKTGWNTITKKTSLPIQHKIDKGLKQQLPCIHTTVKPSVKFGDKKIKNFFIVLLFTIAVVAVFTLIIWGLIWLANLSLLGLIAAIVLGIFVVLWPIAIIIDFIWGHGISGIH